MVLQGLSPPHISVGHTKVWWTRPLENQVAIIREVFTIMPFGSMKGRKKP